MGAGACGSGAVVQGQGERGVGYPGPWWEVDGGRVPGVALRTQVQLWCRWPCASGASCSAGQSQCGALWRESGNRAGLSLRARGCAVERCGVCAGRQPRCLALGDRATVPWPWALSHSPWPLGNVPSAVRRRRVVVRRAPVLPPALVAATVASATRLTTHSLELRRQGYALRTVLVARCKRWDLAMGDAKRLLTPSVKPPPSPDPTPPTKRPPDPCAWCHQPSPPRLLQLCATPGYLQVRTGAVYVTRDHALLGPLGLCLLLQ